MYNEAKVLEEAKRNLKTNKFLSYANLFFMLLSILFVMIYGVSNDSFGYSYIAIFPQILCCILTGIICIRVFHATFRQDNDKSIFWRALGETSIIFAIASLFHPISSLFAFITGSKVFTGMKSFHLIFIGVGVIIMLLAFIVMSKVVSSIVRNSTNLYTIKLWTLSVTVYVIFSFLSWIFALQQTALWIYFIRSLAILPIAILGVLVWFLLPLIKENLSYKLGFLGLISLILAFPIYAILAWLGFIFTIISTLTTKDLFIKFSPTTATYPFWTFLVIGLADLLIVTSFCLIGFGAVKYHETDISH